MVRQTPVNGAAPEASGEPPFASVGDVSSHATDLVYDVITLIELQFKLLYVDVREVLSRATGGVVLLAALVAVVLGCVPVLLVAMAELLVMHAGWGRPGAYFLIAGAAGLVAIAVGLVTVRRLRSVGAVLARSHAELLKNLEFAKSLASSPRRNPQDRGTRF